MSRENFLRDLKKLLPEKSTGAEIGVLHGDFSQMILDILEPEKLFLVDPYACNEKRYGGQLNITTAYSTEEDYQKLLLRFEKEIRQRQVIVIKLLSFEAAAIYHEPLFDFAYIDGSHLREDAKRDLKDWYPLLKNNGILCGHDYIDFQDFGVKQAVDEFIKENNLQMILLNEDGGDWAVKK